MDDRELSTLLSDAVADVEPADRLAEIRARTAPHASRRGWYAAGGTLLAVAAAVTAIALAANQDSPRAEDPGPVASQSPDSTTPTPQMSVSPAYYLGETPMGTRLYREFRRVEGDAEGAAPLPTAIQLLELPPDDPDYRTPWPVGAFETARVIGDGVDPLIEVLIADETLRNRPADMSDVEAAIAVEQVIYTVQAVVGERLPVQFRLGENPIDQVLGVQTNEPLVAAPQLDVLALVNISNPSEGLEVQDSFVADGRASSYEGTVPWQLRDERGAVVRQGFAQAGMDDHLVPWETEPIDVSDLEPGSYVFVAQISDPSDGEGPGPFEDTRTIVVR